MFGSSNPFGQSSSPFGTQPVFGQTNNTNNATNNPFAPQSFGNTPSFGSQSGNTLFGGTSTGVFGAAQPSSPFSSTTTFGASSSPAFGSSMPSFGASSSSSFGGSSVFGQKPAFGFGSTTQSSPFGSATQQSQPGFGNSPQPSQPAFGSTPQQSQPAFGSSIFGSSTPFGAPAQSAFGTSSTPAFGSTSTPAFGATSTPAFGSTTTSAFGSSGTGFGVSNTPVFGSGSAFGASSTPAFGASSNPAFGATSSSVFGASSAPAFGAPSTPSFSFGSSPAFGQTSSAFGSSQYGTTPSAFGAQSSPFGAQATTPTFGSNGFGQSGFGGQRGGSRVAPYTPTAETDSGTGTQPAGKLESITAMPVYKDKSHEELRWEDYQLGDKGGPSPASQASGGVGFGSSTTQSNPFNSSAFNQPQPQPQPQPNAFSASTSSNPFAPKTPTIGSTGFGSASTGAFGSSPFGQTSLSNLFGPSGTTPSLFGSSSAFGASSSSPMFGSTSSPAIGSSPSIFGTVASQGTTPAFNSNLGFSSSQPSPLFNSTTPSLGQTSSGFGQSTSAFGPSTTSFGQSSLFNTPSTGFGGLYSSSSSLNTSTNTLFGQTNSSLTTPFQPTQPAQTSGSFGFGNFGQTQPASTGAFGGSGMFGQNNFGQPSATPSSVMIQPVAVTNPFGTLPTMPQMSIARAGTGPSIQYGISNLPVVDKPAPVRISSLVTSRHLSQRRIRLPARKYRPNNDGPKVPFFRDDEEMESTPKADALFIPRENPRALIIRPTEQWPPRTSKEKSSPLKDTTNSVHENGNASKNGPHVGNRDKSPVEDGVVKDQADHVKANQNGSVNKEDSYKTLTGHRAGEAAIVYEHGADIEALMPKLRRSDYYTEPRIQELAAKERGDPGFCRHVKDFVVGRHGYGSIKFMGETDVRRLDLENLVQFNNREVIVYMDESKKPPVGQGLNKPAEVTLLNIKCCDKSGRQYTEGPKVEKYKEMLKRKAEDQGAEFVSYDPIKGEWKFRVDHFSGYKLGDEDDWDY